MKHLLKSITIILIALSLLSTVNAFVNVRYQYQQPNWCAEA
jgi:hypothetical protein